MQKFIKVCGKWVILFSFIWLCGCAGLALHRDFSDYTEVYADSINRQLLLNLARMSHDEPAYFIQLGTISSQYQFSTSAGFAPTHTRFSQPGIANGLQDTLTLGGTLNAAVTESPIFSFIPLNGDTFAEAITTPISTKVFLTFYDQGYHADMLARTMVASVQMEQVNNSGQTNFSYYVNKPHDPTYPAFLVFCDHLRKAQQNQTLIVDTINKDTPAIYQERTMNLNDEVNAIKAGMNVKYNTNGAQYIVTRIQTDQNLVPNNAPMDKDVTIATRTNRGGKMALVSEDLETQQNYINSTNFAQIYSRGRIKLKMRTFETIMYSVAKEEVYFKELEDTNKIFFKNIQYYEDPYGAIARVTPNQGIPFLVRPILKIKYNENERQHLATLAEVKFKNANSKPEIYSVGDLENQDKSLDETNEYFPGEDVPQANNRFVFTLISYLFSQFAIDPQKLPVQQLIQVQ